MISGADISDCAKYRYLLWRIWDESKPMITFIGLNPSTADHIHDDATIRRCMRFAESWGGGGIYMANIFAYCATNPADMMQAIDPIGPRNDETLLSLTAKSSKVVICWGNHGSYLNRSEVVKKNLEKNIYYLELNKSGEPKHPLYIAANCQLKPY